MMRLLLTCRVKVKTDKETHLLKSRQVGINEAIEAWNKYRAKGAGVQHYMGFSVSCVIFIDI